ISCDPKGPVDGVNICVYARDNPVNLRDLTGMQAGPWQPYIQMRQLAEAVRPIGEAADAAGDVVTGVGEGVLNLAAGLFKTAADPVGTAFNIIGSMRKAYREYGGGSTGVLMAVNQVNPAF